MGTMFDTVGDPKHTFEGLPVEAVAAYGNGRFANSSAAKSEYPHAHHLEIDVSGAGIGDCGDFEPGDMGYAEVGRWAAARIKAGVERPVVYFSVSSWEPVLASIHAAGLERHHVRLWTAHYNGRPHLCNAACAGGVDGTADATQWGSAGAPGTLPAPYHGRNMDVSETSPSFW